VSFLFLLFLKGRKVVYVMTFPRKGVAATTESMARAHSANLFFEGERGSGR